MTLKEQLQDALSELEAWQENAKDAQRVRSSLLYWAFKVTSLANQLADEAIREIIEEMKVEEIHGNNEDYENAK